MKKIGALIILLFAIAASAQEIVEPATTMNPGDFQAQIAVIYSENRESRFRENENLTVLHNFAITQRITNSRIR